MKVLLRVVAVEVEVVVQQPNLKVGNENVVVVARAVLRRRARRVLPLPRLLQHQKTLTVWWLTMVMARTAAATRQQMVQQ